MSLIPPDSITDLLIARATSGLSDQQAQMLDELLWESDIEDDLSFERTVACIDVALARNDLGELPPRLKDQLLRAGRQMVGNQATPANPEVDLENRRLSKSVSYRREWLAWLACAASLMIAATVALPGIFRNGPITIEQLANLPDLKRMVLQAAGDPSAQSLQFAEVLWSDSRQEGYIRWRGLAPNDPAVDQYQLWVIDRKRGFEQRVDGGVFDVRELNGSLHFRAKLHVADAEGFAVTREAPEGVVLSDLSRIVALTRGPAE